MTNSVYIEGVMTAGLTTDGRFTIENVHSEGGEEKTNVFLCKLTQTLLENENVRRTFINGTTFRFVGCLSKDFDGELMVIVEYFERLGVRVGKYTFTNKD